MHLLVIDDDHLIRNALRRVLEIDGHTIVEAASGQTGIDAFQNALSESAPFAAVITDLTMPHMSGTEVARAIKAMSATTPVILLTGWGTGGADDASAHVDHVLGKPPRLKELRETLSRCHNPSA